MISLIRIKFDSTVNQMQPLSPVIRIKGNQRRPLTVFDHTFDVRKGVFFVQCKERKFIQEILPNQRCKYLIYVI